MNVPICALVTANYGGSSGTGSTNANGIYTIKFNNVNAVAANPVAMHYRPDGAADRGAAATAFCASCTVATVEVYISQRDED